MHRRKQMKSRLHPLSGLGEGVSLVYTCTPYLLSISFYSYYIIFYYFFLLFYRIYKKGVEGG